MQLLSITANNKIGFVREVLPQLLPQLYKQTVVDESLKKVVDLGPFKHTIDEGLDLRKAAFECMDFLLENAPETLQYQDFITHLQLGVVVSFLL